MPARRKGVVAVVLRGDRMLVIRRAAAVADPGYWAPVSGTVEPDEGEAAAVAREVREEVGLTVRPLRRVWACVSASGTHDLGWWLAEYVSGELVPDGREVSAAVWVRPAEFLRLAPTFAGDRAFFRHVFPSLPEGGAAAG
jgi:8-oxo-dGTP diphosphatase